jgi:hypothetical protein
VVPLGRDGVRADFRTADAVEAIVRKIYEHIVERRLAAEVV